MTLNTTRCSRWSRLHQQAIGYENELQTMPLEMIQALWANADRNSAEPGALVPNAIINQSHSGYKSDHRLDIADSRAAQTAINDDRQNECRSGGCFLPSTRESVIESKKLFLVLAERSMILLPIKS